MVKKAYMKTIEILLVIILTTMILLMIIPKPNVIDVQQKNFLITMEKNSEFRNFISLNSGCFNKSSSNSAVKMVNGYIPEGHDFMICIDDTAELPDKDSIFANSILFAGNYSSINVKTVRLYFWQ